MVLAFFSNQQTFDSIGNAQGSINTVVTDGTTYVNDTINVGFNATSNWISCDSHVTVGANIIVVGIAAACVSAGD